ncbi:hypothetical protein [Pseudomonas sp. 11/12A]|nr:hypothetical protein [Pseudomonas sp. 11/12A]
MRKPTQQTLDTCITSRARLMRTDSKTAVKARAGDVTGKQVNAQADAQV